MKNENHILSIFLADFQSTLIFATDCPLGRHLMTESKDTGLAHQGGLSNHGLDWFNGSFISNEEVDKCLLG